MEDNIERVTGPMLVKLLEERELLAAYFYDGSMTNDVRFLYQNFSKSKFNKNEKDNYYIEPTFFRPHVTLLHYLD